MYQKTELKNGVRVVTYPMKDRSSVALGFLVGVGGRYEADRIKGAAHFLEHILFKGSRKYSCEEIKEKVEGVGGALNAFTSEEETCYYAKFPYQYLNQTFDVLSDMVLHPNIAKDDVNKERTVIMEEIKMYKDLPQYFVIELLEELVWPNQPLGKSLAGSLQTVGAMTHDDLKDFHQQYYSANNLVVAACGRVAHKDVVKLVAKKFASLKKNSGFDYVRADKSQAQPRLKIYEKAIEQSHLALGMLGYDEHHEDRYALSLLSIILGGNMSSRLFVEVREKRGLAYSISSSYKALHDTGVFMVRAGIDNQKVNDALSVIMDELNKIKGQGVSADEFKRGRDYLIGQITLSLEDTMDHMLWIGEDLISKNRVRSLKSIIQKLRQITPKDIKRVAKDVIDNRKFNLAIVGPLASERQQELEKLYFNKTS